MKRLLPVAGASLAALALAWLTSAAGPAQAEQYQAGRMTAAGQAATPSVRPHHGHPRHARTRPARASAAHGRTVVTFAWGGSLASQMAALPILGRYHMPATYFVASGLVCMQSQAQCRTSSLFLSKDDLKTLAAGGNEIGGLTVLHEPISALPTAETKREICDDRSNLLRWGYQATDFAYPYATVTGRMKQLTRQCGYNSGLGTGQLKGAGLCPSCAIAETMPPADPFDLRTPIEVNSVNTTWTPGTYESIVRDVQAHGGGWVIFTIHAVCAQNCPLGVTPAILREVVSWLHGQAAHGTVVRTVRQVVGGPVRPAVAGPQPRPVPSPGIVNSKLAAAAGGLPACFQRAVYGGTVATFSYDPGGGPHADAAVTMRMTRLGTGNAKLMPVLDLGQCAPEVHAGRGYSAGVWYKSDHPVQLEFYYRNTVGAWAYWTTSTTFPAASSWRQASWTTPLTPAGATAVSFGLTAKSAATISTAQYSLSPAPSHRMIMLFAGLAVVVVAGGLIARGQRRYNRLARAEAAAEEQEAAARAAAPPDA
jgi:peptidoglycan/xylan/chitin deacetylase (PgdA/CDA1 family)